MRPNPLYRGTHAGWFSWALEKEVFGQLNITDEAISIRLRNEKYFQTHNIPENYVEGRLHDLQRVSLHRCYVRSGTGTTSVGSERYNTAELISNYAIIGHRHLGPKESVINAIDFVLDDAGAIFFDADLFSRLVVDARPFINPLIKAQNEVIERKIQVGEEPEIFFYTGKKNIFSVKTKIGTVSATNSLSFGFGSPKELRVQNTIFVSIDFDELLVLTDALRRMAILVEFLGIVAGRPQNIDETRLRIQKDDGTHFLQVFARAPRYERPLNIHSIAPQPWDILLNAVNNPDAFASVTKNWLDRDETWRDARSRLYNCFKAETVYGHDRLIGAANSFDLLPQSAAPKEVILPAELTVARKTATAMFKTLPNSPERESVLSELGRLGQSKLKNKIRHRAQIVIDAEPKQFPDLFLVVDQAVDCRNHYVHGGKAKIEYGSNFQIVVFLNDTLEYVFAISDLLEAGWDIKAWKANGTSLSHPFSAYRHSYSFFLDKLKKLLTK